MRALSLALSLAAVFALSRSLQRVRSLAPCRTYARSVAVLEPLLARHGEHVPRTDPAWQSWLAHVEYVKMSMRYSFRRSQELPAMSAAIKKHHERYQMVPQYKGLMKPKNHATTHLGLTVSDLGPLRAIWCMAFERFNQTFKRIAETSNFFDIVTTMVEFWIISSALQIRNGMLLLTPPFPIPYPRG